MVVVNHLLCNLCVVVPEQGFLLENVGHLSQMNGGALLEHILAQLRRAGYDRCERVIIVLHLHGEKVMVSGDVARRKRDGECERYE